MGSRRAVRTYRTRYEYRLIAAVSNAESSVALRWIMRRVNFYSTGKLGIGGAWRFLAARFFTNVLAMASR